MYPNYWSWNNISSESQKFKHLPYGFRVIKYNNIGDISRHFDILSGLYFPNAQIGQVIRISIGPVDNIVSEFVITDPTKIYLPINNLLMISLLNLQFTNVRVYSGNQGEYYVIGTLFDNDLRQYIAQNRHSFKIYNKDSYFVLRYGEGWILRENNNTIERTVHLDYHASKIQKNWKRYLKIKKVHKTKWTLVGQEIKALPERGVDYFTGKKRFEQLKLK